MRRRRISCGSCGRRRAAAALFAAALGCAAVNVSARATEGQRKREREKERGRRGRREGEWMKRKSSSFRPSVVEVAVAAARRTSSHLHLLLTSSSNPPNPPGKQTDRPRLPQHRRGPLSISFFRSKQSLFFTVVNFPAPASGPALHQRGLPHADLRRAQLGQRQRHLLRRQLLE